MDVAGSLQSVGSLTEEVLPVIDMGSGYVVARLDGIATARHGWASEARKGARVRRVLKIMVPVRGGGVGARSIRGAQSSNEGGSTL